MTRDCDPVGAVEIAARLGVARRTVDQWRQRPMNFPEPRWTVGGRPAWNWDDVEGWHNKRTDARLPVEREVLLARAKPLAATEVAEVIRRAPPPRADVTPNFKKGSK